MSVTALLLTAAGGVALLLVLVIWLKLHAFVALLLTSFVVALIAGIPLADIVPTITAGMGDTLGFVAIVVGLGVMIGQIIQVSGGAQRVAFTLIKSSARNVRRWRSVSPGSSWRSPCSSTSG